MAGEFQIGRHWPKWRQGLENLSPVVKVLTPSPFRLSDRRKTK